MYTAFYGLREKPFALSPDPRFLFLAESHREALAHLLYGIEQGEGFIAVTGEVGTGKTTLCRTLLDRLGSETSVAFLFNPSRSATELLQSIATEYGLDVTGRTRREIGQLLNEFLLEQKRQKRQVLLIIDEAQNLSSGTLEQVRLLSNLETASEKLIQILLLGQPELDVKLDSRGLRQLRQRISVRWSLHPMTREETGEYVAHRLRVAAGGERPIFTKRAGREIHRRTGGIPRLVNVLCDRALLLGYGEQVREIDAKLVRQAAKEVHDTRRRARSQSRASDGEPEIRLGRWSEGPRLVALAAAGVALFLVSLTAGIYVDDVRGWLAPGADGAAPEVASAPPEARDAPPLRPDEMQTGVVASTLR